VASVQPAQIALDERSAGEKLGEERASRYYALRTFLENGVPLAGGSDWPIVSADVFAGMRAAVERGDGHESQSLTAEEATTMFTRGGAHALTLDGLVGTMAPGAFADFIILDSSSDSSSDSDIVATYVGGKCVHGRCLNGA
jgi:predicted amidohydrolase YtcJ